MILFDVCLLTSTLLDFPVWQVGNSTLKLNNFIHHLIHTLHVGNQDPSMGAHGILMYRWAAGKRSNGERPLIYAVSNRSPAMPRLGLTVHPTWTHLWMGSHVFSVSPGLRRAFNAGFLLYLMFAVAWSKRSYRLLIFQMDSELVKISA